MAAQRRPTERDALAQALRSAVRGEADFGRTARALTTMDASNYRRVPLGVVTPRDADDVAAALAVCRAHAVPVVPRGGGTSIAGQATGTGIVLDLTRHMRGIVELDAGSRTAVVQPGVILDDLRTAAAPHGLTFGPDPATHSRCTLGGMIGNNSCGAHSVAWGTTADNVHGLTVARYGGGTLRLGRESPCPQRWPASPSSSPRTSPSCVPDSPNSRAASPDMPWTRSFPSAEPTSPAPSAAARARSAW